MRVLRLRQFVLILAVAIALWPRPWTHATMLGRGPRDGRQPQSALSSAQVSYKSRTDLRVAQLPSPIPSVGNLRGTNRVITEPDFGNRIVRVTDADTDPERPNFTFVTRSSGSADENSWNTDSTLFSIQNVNGGSYVYSFNPSTMQTSRLHTKGPFQGVDTWSHVSSQVGYSLWDTKIVKYDFGDRKKPHDPLTVFDFTASPNCLGKAYRKIWSTNGGNSFDDSVFAAGFSNLGVQGSGRNVVVWTQGKGCRMWNTGTGAVTGDWGPAGATDTSDLFTIHNVKLSKDGNWVIVIPQKCISPACKRAPHFWQIGTLDVLVADRNTGGHWTEGYTHFVNLFYNPIGSELIRPFSDPAAITPLIANFPPGMTAQFDVHQSWNNVDKNDSVPFLMTSITNNSTASGFGGPFVAAWYDEVIAVSANGDGKVYRFCHTFNTNHSVRFSTANAIGQVSQDGRFFMWSSDWGGTLGSEGGSSACTLPGVPGRTACRGDVFIVELK